MSSSGLQSLSVIVYPADVQEQWPVFQWLHYECCSELLKQVWFLQMHQHPLDHHDHAVHQMNQVAQAPMAQQPIAIDHHHMQQLQPLSQQLHMQLQAPQYQQLHDAQHMHHQVGTP